MDCTLHSRNPFPRLLPCVFSCHNVLLLMLPDLTLRITQVLHGDLVPYLQPGPIVKSKPAMLAALGCQSSLEPDLVLGFLRRWSQAAPAPYKKHQQDDGQGQEDTGGEEDAASSTSPTFTASVEQVGSASSA
jgi:hypothetical protein